MKKRVCVTVDEETERILDKLTKEHRYRNRSHAVEEIINLHWEGIKNDKKK